MHGHTHIPRTQSVRRGFTLMEVLVTVLIIGLLMSLLLVGLRAAANGARRQAERAAAVNMGTAVSQFKTQFGFLPPLVHDGVSMSVNLPEAVAASGGNSPVDTMSDPTHWYPAAYSRTKDSMFFLGRDAAGNRLDPNHPTIGTPWNGEEPEMENQRYSKFSLSYYLVGVLGSAVDGIDGPGMVTPIRTGAFQDVATQGTGASATGTSASRNRYEAFFEATRKSGSVGREYLDDVELEENNLGTAVTIPPDEEAFYSAIVDLNGKAFRFYRWEHGNPNNASNAVLSLDDLNIPRVLLDPVALVQGVEDPIGTDSQLKSATWAIVGAGKDGLFGTEPWDVIANEYGYPVTGASTAEIARGRADAQEDNIVVLESK